MEIKVGDTVRINAGVWGEITAEVLENESDAAKWDDSIRIKVIGGDHDGYIGVWDLSAVTEVVKE